MLQTDFSTTNVVEIAEHKQILDKLFESAVNNQFMGIDPYDLASSRVRVPFGLMSKASFLNKVSPINFRSMFGIGPSENSKSNALFLHALVNDDVAKHQNSIASLTGWFEQNRSLEFEQFSVGFAFEMALSRYSSGPGKTSLIISLFTIFAFIELYEKTKDDVILEHIRSFEKLLDEHWLKVETDSTLWYSYLADEQDEVYNATAKVGRFFSALYKIDNNPKYLQRIDKVLKYLEMVQNADGTWAYSTKIDYVDGFHTSFILEAIFEMRCVTKSSEYKAMFEKGLENYCTNLFDKDRPLHFHPNHRPKDIRSNILRSEVRDAANAIILFSKLGMRQKAKEVLGWTVSNFYNADKEYFFFYDNLLMKSRINYIRWQGWMALAISEYQKQLDANA